MVNLFTLQKTTVLHMKWQLWKTLMEIILKVTSLVFGKAEYHFTVPYKTTDCSVVLLICSFRICILLNGSALSALKLNPGTL